MKNFIFSVLAFLIFSTNAFAVDTFIREAFPKRYATGLTKKSKVGFPHDNLGDVDVVIPETYDLRDKISPIRNQGQCGSCWAFSTTATLLDSFVLHGKNPGALSEQYLVDCDTTAAGCGGGYFTAFDSLVEPKGSPLLSEYPYVGRNGRCKPSKPAASLTEWHYVGSEGRIPTVVEIQKAILLYGPVSVTVGADNAFMSYKSGVYNYCSNQRTNHMTNIVGWDDKNQYWIMRNSWGESWGEKGFMRIKYKGKKGNLCNRLGEEAAFVKILGEN